MFSTLVIAYLFLGGTAGGTFFVVSTKSLSLLLSDNQLDIPCRRIAATQASHAFAVALLMLAASILCLLNDLEFPDRVLLLFIRPHATVLTVGSFSLLGMSAIGLLLTLASRIDPLYSRRVFFVVAHILCCVFATATMVYTGVFLATNASVPFWNTPWLVPLFLFSSLSSGMAVVSLTEYLSLGHFRDASTIAYLSKTHLVCLLGETIFLVLFIVAEMTNRAALKSIDLLLGADMLATGIVGAIVLGIAIPAFSECYSLIAAKHSIAPFPSVACLAGCFSLRYCIAICGVH